MDDDSGMGYVSCTLQIKLSMEQGTRRGKKQLIALLRMKQNINKIHIYMSLSPASITCTSCTIYSNPIHQLSLRSFPLPKFLKRTHPLHQQSPLPTLLLPLLHFPFLPTRTLLPSIRTLRLGQRLARAQPALDLLLLPQHGNLLAHRRPIDEFLQPIDLPPLALQPSHQIREADEIAAAVVEGAVQVEDEGALLRGRQDEPPRPR